MTGLSALALLASFAAGVVSFLSPCVLPLVPGYVSYVAGQSITTTPPRFAARAGHRALPLGICFVMGFSTVFILLGASATALGRLVLSYRQEADLVAGAVVVGFGLLLMRLVRWPRLQRDFRFHPDIRGGRPVAAYVLGLAFAFGWTPCIGPVLGAILTASAASATVAQGVILLAVYSAGLGIPFLLAAVFTSRLLRRRRGLGRVGRVLQIGMGGIVVAMGVAMLTGQLTVFSYWLLETFPALARIG